MPWVLKANIRGAKGEGGTTGAQGLTGPPNTLRVGKVTTAIDTSLAAATITGVAPNQTLELVIPRGLAGPETAPTDQSLAGYIGTKGTATAAILDAEYGDKSEVFSDFRMLPNGNPPVKFDTGQLFRYAAEPPKIVSGALVTPSPTSSGKATYIEPDSLSGQLTRVGAEFVIRRTSSTQTNGSLAMGAWSDPGVVNSYPNGYPVAGAHFVINKDRWTYNIYADTDSKDIGAGDFVPALSENVPLRLEIFFSGDRAIISLPNGTTAILQDARIAQYVAGRPFWEPFQGRGVTDTNVGILSLWAEGTARAPGKQALTTAEAAVMVSARSEIIKAAEWRPAVAEAKALSSANWLLQPLTFTMVWPASKTVSVEAEAWVDVPAGVSLYYAFLLNNSITGAWTKVSTGVSGRLRLSTMLRPAGAKAFIAGNVVKVSFGMFSTGGVATLQLGPDQPAILTAVPVSGVWNVQSIADVTPPVIPGDSPIALTLAAVAASASSVTLTWPKTDATVTSVEIWSRRSGNGGTTWNTASISGTRSLSDSPYTLAGLAAATLHEIWLIAKNPSGASPESNRVQVQL